MSIRTGVMAMRYARLMRSAMVGLAGFSGLAVAARGPMPAALAALEPGRWQFRDVDANSVRAMCVGDPRALIQIGHQEAGCSRFVTENGPSVTTVRYTCPGIGHGRTTITVETPRLARVRTQGILGGAPFDEDYEARRLGACG